MCIGSVYMQNGKLQLHLSVKSCLRYFRNRDVAINVYSKCIYAKREVAFANLLNMNALQKCIARYGYH